MKLLILVKMLRSQANIHRPFYVFKKLILKTFSSVLIIVQQKNKHNTFYKINVDNLKKNSENYFQKFFKNIFY